MKVYKPMKIRNTKDSFYEELEKLFDQFPRYHMKILLGDFNAKVGREDISKPIIGNESLHEVSNDNGARVVNFATIPPLPQYVFMAWCLVKHSDNFTNFYMFLLLDVVCELVSVVLL
jgi:hypothetical protein